MGRPLAGSLRSHQGLWWVSVPEVRGSSRRRHESFVAEDDARTWQAQAVIALRQNRPLPDPDRFRTTTRAPRKPTGGPQPAKIQPDIASVARAWMNAAYEDLRRGGPDRAERVRRIIDGFLVPWFAPRTTTVADVTYYMVHDWLLHLVGRDHSTGSRSVPAKAASLASRVDTGAADELTLADAARLSGMSLPTVRRRWRNGELPGAYRNPKGHVRVPMTALDTVHSKRQVPTGLSQRYVADALWVLRRVLGFARANGLAPAGFDPTESLDAPTPDPAVARTRRPTRQPRPLTLPECARVAAHLQPVHQIAFWLQRIMGLRVSEAFGLLLGDVIELGDTALLAAQGQGGRTFNVRDDHGVVVAAPYKATMKTAAGSRMLVVPAKVLELIHLSIEAFHADPVTGRVDPTDRLVPGIRETNRSGQQGYVHAFEGATVAEGLSTADLGFRVSSHLLRKSLATDLAWQEGIEDAVRRRFMGHRAGDDVFGRIYTLDHPEIAPLIKVAAILDDKIIASIGTLLTPTTRRPYWGKQNPLRARAEHITATLVDAGWVVDPGSPDDPLCDAERVAAELDIHPNTARRWMADGTLTAIVAPDAQGVPRRYSRLSTVWAQRDRLARRVLLPDLAEQLGVRYHEVYNTVRRLGLVMEQHPATRMYEVTPHAADAVRSEFGRVQALHRRSMKLPAAAVQLHLAASTVRLLAQRGDLVVDPETDSSGLRFVTRTSVRAYWIAHNEAKRRPAQPIAAVPLAEVARFTGETPRALMDLVRAGVLEQVPGRRAAHLTAPSLRAWIAEREPEVPDEVDGGGAPAPVTPLRPVSRPTDEESPARPVHRAGGGHR
jgi:integrase